MAQTIFHKACLWCKRPFISSTKRVMCCSPSCAGLNRVGPIDQRFWTHVTKTRGCWIFKQHITLRKYRFIKDRGEMRLAHRVSWELTHGPIPDGLIVCHKCDNPPCVNPDHLFLGTHKDNSQDMARKGKSQYGRKNTKAKLTDADVVAIRASDKSGNQIAKDYGIWPSQVSHIRLRKQWKHIP